LGAWRPTRHEKKENNGVFFKRKKLIARSRCYASAQTIKNKIKIIAILQLKKEKYV